MLLVGFNILLETVERKLERLVARLPQLRQWASVDLVRDAGAIMVRSTGNCRGWGRGIVTSLDSWEVYQHPRLGLLLI